MDQYFDAQAARWDTPARIRRAARIAQELRRRLPRPHYRVAMELGSGTGLVGFAMAGLADQLILTDPAPAMVEILRRKAACLPAGGPQVQVCLAPPGRLPKLERPCGLIFHSMALHHVQDVAQALQDFFLLLEPGGCLCFADLDPVDRRFHSNHPDFTGYNGFAQPELQAAMRRAGFAAVRSATFLRDEKQIDGTACPFSLFWMCGVKPPEH